MCWFFVLLEYAYYLHQIMYKIEFLNVLMLLGAFFTALIIPFDLFLFAYAFLGPLHYLTEIRWLHSKDYFITAPLSRSLFIVSVSVSIFVLSFLPHSISDHGFILFFLLAILFVFFRNKYVWGGVLLACVALSFYVRNLYIILVGILIPTLVHVYLFTFMFMVQAARRKKVLVYWVAPILHVVLGILCVWSGWIINAESSSYAKNVFQDVRFGFIETFMQIGNSFALTVSNIQDLFNSPQGLAISRLFAFAYTYHYLNWFVKTSVIGWSLMSKRAAVIIGVLWVGSLGLYVYDYIVGMFVLLLLSVLHVILEFPLNIRSIAGVFAKSSKT